MKYSIVDSDGILKHFHITEDPNYPVNPGERLLPDILPDPKKFEYIEGITRIHRVQPVPKDATQVIYEIVEVDPENRNPWISPEDLIYFEEFKHD